MTAIAVKIEKDKIYLASDSYSSNTFYKRNNCQKIWSINNIVFGSAGNDLEARLFAEYCKQSTYTKRINCFIDILDFMHKFYDYRNDILLYKKDDNSVEEYNQYILIVNKKVFYIEYENRLVKRVGSYCAIGSGEEMANAILCDGGSASHAVEIACKISKHCGLPIQEIIIER